MTRTRHKHGSPRSIAVQGIRPKPMMLQWNLLLLVGLAVALRAVAAEARAGRAPAGAVEVYVDLRHATRASAGWGTARNNASVEGKPLRIGSAEFAQGIGTHAPTEIVLPLDGQWRWLTFYCGVSADMTEKGSVTVQVWVDGEKAFDAGVMRVHEEPRYVSLSVAGRNELKLVGTDAGDGLWRRHD